MAKKEKVGCLLSIPVIILSMCCPPLCLILIILRIIKTRKLKQKQSIETYTEFDNKKVTVNDIEIPQEFINEGKKIEDNLAKELYCNKKDLPREIFADTKWLWLLQILVIVAYIYIIRGCDTFGTGFLWTIFLIGATWPIYWNIFTRTRYVKECNKQKAENLRSRYQDTFNALVFSEYLERKLVEAGFIHSNKDTLTSDEPECRKFYHYYSYVRKPLRYKYSNHETEYVDLFRGFDFDNSIWKNRQFCYSIINPAYDKEYMRGSLYIFSPKEIENEIFIHRKESEYHLNEDAVTFKKYDLDNSRFNEKYNTYSENSIELFKVMTPSYMEKILLASEKTGIGAISILGDNVHILFDSHFPTLKNSSIGFDVGKALANAENAFQEFLNFMEIVNSL